MLILQSAVESTTTNKTTVVGDDTDLWILLHYHASISPPIFFKPEPNTMPKQVEHGT